jgi:hypothetical protein
MFQTRLIHRFILPEKIYTWGIISKSQNTKDQIGHF